jgi:uncharacterized protein YabE (DUF348 family)
MPLKKRVQILALLLLLAACQPQSAARVRLIVDGQVRDIAASDLVPAHMLANAAIAFSPADRVLMNGMPVPFDQAIQPQGFVTLQLRRAVPVTLIAPNGQMTVNTAERTVGEALLEAGVSLFVSDRVEPPVETLITSGMLVTITPGREVTFQAGGKSVRVRSSAATVGQAAAEAGIPLTGLDTSIPSENEALPADGQVRIVHVSESTSTAYKTIPYETQLIVTTELEPPLQDVLDPGEIGLSLNRTRVRYEDGAEISRVVESESVIRLPRTRVVRSSYWRAIQMYATSYSPCRSGADKCYSGTSSGLPVARGVVAMKYDWYLALGGLRVYVPGYGLRRVERLGDSLLPCTRAA